MILPFFTCKNIQILIRNEARITPLPIIPINDLDKCFRPNPLIRNPINGKKGISQTICKTFFITQTSSKGCKVYGIQNLTSNSEHQYPSGVQEF